MRRLMIALSAATVLFVAAPAAAQGGTEVPVGDSFSVQNGTECPPNAEVVASVAVGAGEGQQVGLAIADPNGHFTIEATLPETMALGPATVTVECGLDAAVLVYDIVVVENTGRDLLAFAPYVAIGAALVAAGGVVLARKGRDAGDRGSAIAVESEDSELAGVAAADDATYEDDSEYWFWDNDTELGPVKRIACLSETGFYLHEVPAEEFGGFVDLLAQVGPDTALVQSFFSVPVADIDEVHHRGTQLRFVCRRDGQKVAQVIDLGTELSGVLDLLSRRVHVVAGSPVPAG